MWRRALMVLVVGSLTVGFTPVARARTWQVQFREAQVYRQQVRSLPLLVRPQRPGHFYGNTVRGIYYRSNSPAIHRTFETLHPPAGRLLPW